MRNKRFCSGCPLALLKITVQILFLSQSWQCWIVQHSLSEDDWATMRRFKGMDQTWNAVVKIPYGRYSHQAIPRLPRHGAFSEDLHLPNCGRGISSKVWSSKENEMLQGKSEGTICQIFYILVMCGAVLLIGSCQFVQILLRNTKVHSPLAHLPGRGHSWRMLWDATLQNG